MCKKEGLVLHEKDNVGTALNDLTAGSKIPVTKNQTITLTEDIPYGFKFSLHDIARGEAIIKYGEAIGQAKDSIKAGSLVHIHNTEGQRARGDL